MTRLVAFGCSFTYGQSMPICSASSRGSDAESQPSMLAWPAVLAHMMNVECANHSTCGASNLEILYTILNFEFKKSDIVVIMWSLPQRDLFFKRWGTPFRQLGAWMTDRVAKKWIMSSDEYDYTQRTWMHMHHADLYLKMLDVKYIHYPAVPPRVASSLKNLTISNLYLSGQAHCDTAGDHSHPGINSHKQTAAMIFNILNEHNT